MIIGNKLGTVLAIGLLAFMPLETLLVNGLGPGDLFIVLLIIATLVQVYRQRKDFRFPLAFPIWLIFVGSLIGTASGLSVGTAAKALLQEVYLVLFFVTLANCFTDRESLNKFIKIWAIIALVEGFIIILDRMGIRIPVLGGAGAKVSVLSGNAVSGAGRAVGTFMNANAAGGYMMLTLFIVLATQFPKKMSLRLGLSVVYILAVLATGSVGATLGLGLGLVAWLVYWLHRRGRPILFFFGVVMLVALLAIIVSPVLLSIVDSGGQNSITFEINLIANKVSKRLNLWNTDLQLLSEYPLGIGPNVTADMVVIGAHSDYVAFLVERGAIGFIGLILLLGEVVYWVILAMRDGHKESEHNTTGALLGGVLGLCVMALVHETTHGRPVWMLFAAVFLNYRFVQAEARSLVSSAGTILRPSPKPLSDGGIKPASHQNFPDISEA